MLEDNVFDLSDLFIDSLNLDANISPQVKNQFKKTEEDPILKLLRKDPREVLGFNRFCKPQEIPESAIGTPIQEFYRGLNVFVTGGTGFVGKVLIEKLIRSVPHLGKIYVLIRTKKGMSAKERFEKLLEDEVFLRMKTEVPHYQSKLAYIDGDISEPELGLSEADRQTLQSQIHIVFHSAADVRFINSLRKAVVLNFIGSKRVIDLAKGIKNLKSYVHVSTAFSNCVRRVVDEKCYELSVSYNDILKILEEKSDEEIEKEESKIIQGWPNTYTFSKAMCEKMIAEEAQDLPICIFRPSIVWPTYKEPLRGWTDNIYGPNGLLTAVGLGLLHIHRIDNSLSVDTVPVDFTANAMIAVAWETATDRINSMPVYNFTSCPRNPVTWKHFDIFLKYSDAYPCHQATWFISAVTTKSALLEKVGDFFLHTIPAMVEDAISIARGKKPRLVKMHRKLSNLKEKLWYFQNRQWEFRCENITMLLNKLTEEDKKLFYFDIADMRDLHEYLLVGKLGTKYFYLKESLETMPEAARKWFWLKVAHYTLLSVSSLAALKLLVTLAHVLPI